LIADGGYHAADQFEGHNPTSAAASGDACSASNRAAGGTLHAGVDIATGKSKFHSGGRVLADHFPSTSLGFS
jgi:hypothetical protein